MAPKIAASSRLSDTENDFVKTQLVVFYVILLLAVDSINPVKVFLHVFPQIQSWHVATLSILLIIYLFISELKQLLYFSVKIFFHSILSIFFREVQIVGLQNIPQYGPAIFTGNHANQFIDSVVMLSTCQRVLSFLIAEKSWKRRIIGDIAWAMGALPVKRAQDSAKQGSGVVSISSIVDLNANFDSIIDEVRVSDVDTKVSSKEVNIPEGYVEISKDKKFVENKFQVTGIGTKFTSDLNVGDKIRLFQSSIAMKVTNIDNDSSLQVDAFDLPSDYKLSEDPVTYDILKQVDQKVVYEMVLAKLASGGTIGIFPEGGSHDRTDLLPLKVGVALIAYSALEKDGLMVPIVPVGLNYFQGHRFRGRVVVEFGRPIYADALRLTDYQNGGLSRRRVCTELLEEIEDSMRSVIVSTPDYKTLQMIHTARRLYVNRFMSSSEKQDMSRRFAEGYKRLLLLSDENPGLKAKMLDIQQRLKAYQDELKSLGIKDYQVPGLVSEETGTDGDFVLREMRLPYRIAELLLLLMVSLIPALFLNLPVGLIARVYSNRRRKKALAESKVKVKGMDVMLSEKVLLCIVLVPSLWITYGILLYCFTDLDLPALALAFFCMPLFSYMGIVTAEAGMVDLKDLKPYLMRLYPSTRRRLLALPSIRIKLQRDLRDAIRAIGPLLGDVYTEKKMDWAQFQKAARKPSSKEE